MIETTILDFLFSSKLDSPQIKDISPSELKATNQLPFITFLIGEVNNSLLENMSKEAPNGVLGQSKLKSGNFKDGGCVENRDGEALFLTHPGFLFFQTAVFCDACDGAMPLQGRSLISLDPRETQGTIVGSFQEMGLTNKSKASKPKEATMAVEDSLQSSDKIILVTPQDVSFFLTRDLYGTPQGIGVKSEGENIQPALLDTHRELFAPDIEFVAQDPGGAKKDPGVTQTKGQGGFRDEIIEGSGPGKILNMARDFSKLSEFSKEIFKQESDLTNTGVTHNPIASPEAYKGKVLSDTQLENKPTDKLGPAEDLGPNSPKFAEKDVWTQGKVLPSRLIQDEEGTQHRVVKGPESENINPGLSGPVRAIHTSGINIHLNEANNDPKVREGIESTEYQPGVENQLKQPESNIAKDLRLISHQEDYKESNIEYSKSDGSVGERVISEDIENMFDDSNMAFFDIIENNSNIKIRNSEGHANSVNYKPILHIHSANEVDYLEYIDNVHNDQNDNIHNMNSDRLDRISDIIKHIVVNHKKDASEVRITLHPKELGEIKVVVGKENELLSVKITATEISVKNLIESNLNELRSQLESSGHNIAYMNVGLEQKYGSGHNEFYAKRLPIHQLLVFRENEHETFIPNYLDKTTQGLSLFA